MEHKHNTESHQRSSLERSNVELGEMNEQPISINIERLPEENDKGQGDQLLRLNSIKGY